jgi:hypothetical protein
VLTEPLPSNAFKELFEKGETVLWLSFTYSQASLIHETIKVIEGDEKCPKESGLAVKTLLLKL